MWLRLRATPGRCDRPKADDATADAIVARAANEIAVVMGSTSEPTDPARERVFSPTSDPTTLDPPGDVVSPPPARPSGERFA